MQHHDKSYEQKLQQLREKAAQLMKQKQAQNPQQKDDESFEWFSGDARPSPAPVVFHEEPAAPEAKDLSQPLEAAKDPLQDTQEPLEEKKEDEQKIEKTVAEPLEKSSEKILENAEIKTTIEEESEFKTQKKAEEKAAETKEVADKEKANTAAKSSSKKVPEKQKSQSQKKLSLADIAQGLMSKFDENSQHYVSSKGGNIGQPTAEQLKYERYVAKLFACMQKSIKIHRSAMNLDSFHQAEVYFQLTLNRNGTLADVHLLTSCGIKQLDDFIIFIVRDAASSFPPVPSFLKHTSYPLGFIINPSPEKSGMHFSFM
jgi:membrane protein involved in colicin uptake